MVFTDVDKLSVAQIAYYAPAFVLALAVTFRHGFGRQMGWVFIVLLAAFRVAGSACQIAGDQKGDGKDLLTAAAILNSIGLFALLESLQGLVSRVNDGMPMGKRISPRYLRLLHLLLIIGVILGIVRGVKSSKASSQSQDLYKAAIFIFLAAYVILAGFAAWIARLAQFVIPGEKRLLVATAVAYPFLFVRALYSLISAFSSPTSTTFNPMHPNVWVEAFMAIVEEFIVAAIVITVGFLTQRLDRSRVQQGSTQRPQGMPMGKMEGAQYSNRV